MSKKHIDIAVEVCPEHKDRVHLLSVEVEHEDDGLCSIHACDEEVYIDPEYADKANTVGYSKKYAANYESIDWGN